jgi:hypothetical protein
LFDQRGGWEEVDVATTTFNSGSTHRISMEDEDDDDDARCGRHFDD